jgi:acyl-coenzyme A thioesterase PaaI-like protein
VADLAPAAVDEFLRTSYPAMARSHRCAGIGSGFAEVRWIRDPTELRPGELISGPTQFAAADLALWFLSFTVFGLAPMALTTDLHISFLQPARGGDLLARAEMISSGPRRVVGRVLLWIDGVPHRPVSHAVGGYARRVESSVRLAPRRRWTDRTGEPEEI